MGTSSRSRPTAYLVVRAEDAAYRAVGGADTLEGGLEACRVPIRPRGRDEGEQRVAHRAGELVPDGLAERAVELVLVLAANGGCLAGGRPREHLDEDLLA